MRRSTVASFDKKTTAFAAMVKGAETVSPHLALPKLGFALANFIKKTTLASEVAVVHVSSPKPPSGCPTAGIKIISARVESIVAWISEKNLTATVIIE